VYKYALFILIELTLIAIKIQETSQFYQLTKNNRREKYWLPVIWESNTGIIPQKQ